MGHLNNTPVILDCGDPQKIDGHIGEFRGIGEPGREYHSFDEIDIIQAEG